MAWDDEEGVGRTFRRHFADFATAGLWIAETIKESFPKKTHIAVEEMTEKRWHYREGD